MSTLETGSASSLQTFRIGRQIAMVGDSILPEIYHLDGGGNFGVWAYRMKNMLLKDGRFRYCLTPPSKVMGEEERIARHQVLSIINSNAKNNALKLLRRYSNPHECWTDLKTKYKSDGGPRCVMLIEKFFALRKTKSVSMDTHLTEVKEIANLLEEVDVIIPEDIIVYYIMKNLPKEYEIFKKMQISAQPLPPYEQLEAKLISEETSIKMESQHQEDGEALFLHRDRSLGRRFQPVSQHSQFTSTANHRIHRRNIDSGGFSAQRSPLSSASGGSFVSRPRNQNTNFEVTTTITAPYQPRYKPRGPDRQRNNLCNYCGMNGHFERECDLRSIGQNQGLRTQIARATTPKPQWSNQPYQRTGR